MEMTGEQLVPLPQKETWDALNDIMYGRGWMPGTLFVVPSLILAQSSQNDCLEV